MEYWTIVLSSSLISAGISALVAGAFALKGKQREYENAYYKMVLDRRIAAYEEIDRLVTFIKTSVIHEDGRTFHLLFSDEETNTTCLRAVYSVINMSLWLSDDIFRKTQELNRIMFRTPHDEEQMLEFGKQNYKKIAELRTEIEKQRAKDLMDLHKIRKFLKKKKFKDEYEEIKK